MAEVHKIIDAYAIAQANVIRSKDSTPATIKRALYRLGRELGKKIVQEFFLKERKIITPMEYDIEGLVPDIPFSVVFTTKDDMHHYAKGMSEVIDECTFGYMNFEGIRGFQALNSSIREIEFPDTKNTPVHSLIIGKSTLATGCTAVSLTKAALSHFLPQKLIIATIFYSKEGLSYLKRELPNSYIFVIGEPDILNEDGMLLPGIGNLDTRIKE